MSKKINAVEYTTFGDLWNDPELLTDTEKEEIIVSEKEFNDLQKDKRNADYLKKIEQGFQDITDGKGRAVSMEELDAMAGK